MCLRALLFVFTSLLLILSLSLVAAGLWLTIDEASMVQVVSELLNATNTQDDLLSDLPRLKSILDEATTLNILNVVLIAVGGVVFFVALSGFCGARKDSPRLLITFAFFTLVFLALQIALVIHTNNNGDIFADVWESFNASETEARVVNNTDKSERESSPPFLMPMLSVFIQSGVCSLIPGVLLLASLSLACTAGRRKATGYIDTMQDES